MDWEFVGGENGRVSKSVDKGRVDRVKETSWCGGSKVVGRLEVTLGTDFEFIVVKNLYGKVSSIKTMFLKW